MFRRRSAFKTFADLPVIMYLPQTRNNKVEINSGQASTRKYLLFFLGTKGTSVTYKFVVFYHQASFTGSVDFVTTILENQNSKSPFKAIQSQLVTRDQILLGY